MNHWRTHNITYDNLTVVVSIIIICSLSLVIFTRTTYTSSSLRVGLKLRRKSEGLAYEKRWKSIPLAQICPKKTPWRTYAQFKKLNGSLGPLFLLLVCFILLHFMRIISVDDDGDYLVSSSVGRSLRLILYLCYRLCYSFLINGTHSEIWTWVSNWVHVLRLFWGLWCSGMTSCRQLADRKHCWSVT